MLQTSLRFYTFVQGGDVSSPQGNATNLVLKRMITSAFLVSSPQGNATNKFTPPIFCKPAERFKSPRECYKHDLQSLTGELLEGFKSPRECYKPPWRGVYSTLYMSFKSPRECYKLLSAPKAVEKEIAWFQVPKGMLQTRISLVTSMCLNRFKSPRECYKHPGVFFRVYRVQSFQVPKGMLQTSCDLAMLFRNLWFQVPKGMLQTRQHS